ncbi:RidA family protein [Agromyces sp. NPDC056523]|uniref:RidA family protein n=1 Tax=Agromyces sp. NPDC056523 TaxID=3345850 RepID=UPI0036728E6B
MSIRRVRTVPGVAEPVGAFSQVVVAGNLVYTSGQLPVRGDGTTPADFADQLEAAIENLRTLLEAVGSDLAHVVKVNGYLTDPEHLPTYNEVYRRHFGDHLPARTTVCVALWGVSLELECVAMLANGETDA